MYTDKADALARVSLGTQIGTKTVDGVTAPNFYAGLTKDRALLIVRRRCACIPSFPPAVQVLPAASRFSQQPMSEPGTAHRGVSV